MPADGPGYLRIATEEAFAPPELLAAWREMLDGGGVDDPGFRSLWGFYLSSDSERATALRERLQDLGPRRLADMDATGIDRQIISLTAPGAQIFDADRAVAMATTSGMAWPPAIMFTREVLGGDRVLYAMDYPYQFVADEVTAQDQLPLGPAEKKAFFQTNAETVFRL
jgi:predicted TIM-barrel fold metal-dependent hydrolase